MLMMRHIAADPLQHQEELLVAHIRDFFHEQLAVVCAYTSIDGERRTASMCTPQWYAMHGMLFQYVYTLNMHECGAVAPCRSVPHRGMFFRDDSSPQHCGRYACVIYDMGWVG